MHVKHNSIRQYKILRKDWFAKLNCRQLFILYSNALAQVCVSIGKRTQEYNGNGNRNYCTSNNLNSIELSRAQTNIQLFGKYSYVFWNIQYIFWIFEFFFKGNIWHQCCCAQHVRKCWSYISKSTYSDVIKSHLMTS